MSARTPQQCIIDACEAEFDHNKSDCSGFVKDVAKDILDINLSGQANDIVDQIQRAPWIRVKDGAEAKSKADAGFFVIGGLKDNPNGHVVVVVQGPLAPQGKYPTAYWGKLNGIGKKKATINWAWDEDDRDCVIYACRVAHVK
jgi:hypothetical protein